MNLLRTERDTLNAYIPGLDKYLGEIPLLELEQPGNGALQRFRELGGPGLLVPAEYSGKGASLLDAVRIQRAVGSRSPSLAVATTMHHFSVASLVELTAAGNGFEWVMLTAIAENSWLLSSGFAEGKPGQHILTPTMRGVPADGGITVSGVKKPCSLTWSMNLMSASVAVADPATGTDRLAIVLIPADSAGIERAPFWKTTALAAAESDQVTLNQVFVPDALIFYPQDGETMDPIQARGFVWFELLVSASYLGAATNLAERVMARGRGSDEDRAGLAIELEAAAAALEQVASASATAGDNEALLARALSVRFATERAIERVVMSATATLGGMSFIESPEIAYLLGATRALAFHPPSRAAAAGPLARYLAGGPLTLLRVRQPLQGAAEMTEERGLGEGPRGMTERGVEAAAAAVLMTPRDGMVRAHRAAVVARLVDGEQHVNLGSRAGAEVVPLVVPGPGGGQVAGRRVAAVLDGHRGRLLRRVPAEPRAGEPAEVRPVVLGGRRAVDAEPRAARRHVPAQRVPARARQDVAAGGQEGDRRVAGEPARRERRRVLRRVDGPAGLVTKQAQRADPGRDGVVPVAGGARVHKQTRICHVHIIPSSSVNPASATDRAVTALSLYH
jgi:alkylation response protein AidB-like acyl-CoA dehydrogenase